MPRGTPPTGGNSRNPKHYIPPTTGPVTPREIYQLLLNAGFSSVQAAGIMGNMIHESSLNPESGGTDSNGYWAGGLISWNSAGYTNARSLVTGNPQADVRAQIKYLVTSTNGLKQGLAGSTPYQVGANFAEHVEVCATCGPKGGPNGTFDRAASAATVYKAAQSGNWGLVSSSAIPAGGSSPGSGSSPAGGTGSNAGGGTGACLISFPSLGPIGGGCIFGKSSARALIGGLMMGGGMVVGLAGVAVLLASAFGRTKLAGAAAAVPGVGTVAGVANKVGRKAPKPKPKPAAKPAAKPKPAPARSEGLDQ
jgi:hypothetical protein